MTFSRENTVSEIPKRGGDTLGFALVKRPSYVRLWLALVFQSQDNTARHASERQKLGAEGELLLSAVHFCSPHQHAQAGDIALCRTIGRLIVTPTD